MIDGDRQQGERTNGAEANGAGADRGAAQAPNERSEPAVVRLQRRRDVKVPTVELHESVPGSRPGGGFLRLTRRAERKLVRVAEGEWEATRAALRPASAAGRLWAGVRGVLIGPPLATADLPHERLNKRTGLAIFSSDNLSSSAYATEEILLILLLAGTAAFSYAAPIALAIAVLAAIVVTSYRQTIRAYPNGGGAFVVARENIGEKAGLLAGSALFVDYILTVAVSTAAGVAAITSAIPELHDLKVYMAVGFVCLLTLGNLRGIRESGALFAGPTYFFIITFAAMLVVGLVRLAVGDDLSAPHPDNAIEPGTHALTVFLLLRAFASGCAALTGVEAMANAVPYFKPPEAKNASTTLVWMAVILSAFFLGTALLARQLGIVPSETTTVVAQIASTVFGHGSLPFYAVQVGTALILVLAANTSFAGLPAAASIMAREGVVPKQFMFRGDRLAFSNGIIVVGVLSSVLLVVFHADTHALIPLYALGVFMAFTISQSGMVLHWRRSGEPRWRRSAAVNMVGALATGFVALIIAVTKFADGAWISIALMLALMCLMWSIDKHYRSAARQLGQGLHGREQTAGAVLSATTAGSAQTVIIPVDEINRAVLRSVSYARSISPNTIAVHVALDREEAEVLRREWEESVPDVPFVIVDSPYRSLTEPLMAYIEALDRSKPGQMVTVVLTEFVPRRPWQALLHNQLAMRLKRALLSRPNTVIVQAPFHFTE